jgi:hypothetical protein
MYAKPGARLAFGDVIEAPWLFDVYVRSDSRALTPVHIKGGKPGFAIKEESSTAAEDRVFAQATMDPADVVLTNGAQRMAIVLTDDCELATLAGTRAPEGSGWQPRGRIVLASLRAASEDQITAQVAKRDDLGLHGLPPGEGFRGGIVDLNRLFSVQTKSLVGQGASPLCGTVISLDEKARLELANRLAGHLLRHGPHSARIGARKLSQLWTAGGDRDVLKRLGNDREWGDADKAQASKSVEAVLLVAWALGGLILDKVDSAAEQGEPPGPSLAEVHAAITDLRRVSGQALDAFAKAGWTDAGTGHAPEESDADSR